MELSSEAKAILAHVVSDPDAWVTNALASVGEKAITAKIDRWRDDYLAHKDDPDYMTRSQRDVYKSPKQIAVEAAASAKIAAKIAAISDNLPSWVQVSMAVDNIANLADAKVYLKKLSRVVYWLAKDKEA